MATDNTSTAHFNAKHIHSANTLTVYIDDDKVCSFDGGTTRSVKVKPGKHSLTYVVYNDASEEAYPLGPFYENFEAGREYDIYPGMSSEELERRQSEEPRKTTSSATAASSSKNYGSEKTYSSTGTYSSVKSAPEVAARTAPTTAQISKQTKKVNSRAGFIAIVIAVAVISGLCGTRLSASHSAPAPAQATDTPAPSAKPAQVQTAKPPVTAAVETPDAAVTADNAGFIFPDSDTRVLEQWEIEALSDVDLSYAVNELYARHGYIFTKAATREYFEQFSWYAPEIPSDEFSVDQYFNQFEKQNWNLLIDERTSRKESG